MYFLFTVVDKNKIFIIGYNENKETVIDCMNYMKSIFDDKIFSIVERDIDILDNEENNSIYDNFIFPSKIEYITDNTIIPIDWLDILNDAATSVYEDIFNDMNLILNHLKIYKSKKIDKLIDLLNTYKHIFDSSYPTDDFITDGFKIKKLIKCSITIWEDCKCIS